MKIKGWDLDFFNSGEWQVCDERLQLLENQNRRIGRDGYNPGRKGLFNALRSTPLEKVRVAIIGQDPYPSTVLATGLAFSVPAGVPSTQFPPTLQTFLKEYSTDLGYEHPSTGDLGKWCREGVLLWNAVPSCLPNRSLSQDWTEWSYLTREIIRRCSERGVVFALLGQVARRFTGDISPSNNYVITTSHPSPRGSLSSKTPFIGSRLFSTINAKLVENGQEKINWCLDEQKPQRSPRPS